MDLLPKKIESDCPQISPLGHYLPVTDLSNLKSTVVVTQHQNSSSGVNLWRQGKDYLQPIRAKKTRP